MTACSYALVAIQIVSKQFHNKKPVRYAGIRPVGRGFEGVRSNPPFGLQIILYTPPNLHLSALPFQSGPLVSLVLRFTAVQTSPVAAT